MTMTLSGDGNITGLAAAEGVRFTQDAKWPAFSAYNATAQSIPNATWTKLSFSIEEFDTASAFDATTNYRFTPQVAGYYQVNGCVSVASGTGIHFVQIYKNGVGYKQGGVTATNAAANGAHASVLVYLNGSTDYVELYAYQSSGGALNTNNVGNNTYFQAHLLRAV